MSQDTSAIVEKVLRANTVKSTLMTAGMSTNAYFAFHSMKDANDLAYLILITVNGNKFPEPLCNKAKMIGYKTKLGENTIC